MKFIFFPASYVSLLFVFHFTYLNYKNNFLITILLIILIPLPVLYQKYFDPLSIILIFCLYENQLIKSFLQNLNNNIKILYFYFAIIYFGSLSYRLFL